MITAKQKLLQFCQKNTHPHFVLHSRSHKMQTLPLYIKRDDELSLGSKLRKYASILPFLLKNKGKTVALTGSCYSNHVLSLLQLLKQEGIFPKLFLEKPKNQDRKGNYFFLSLLASQEEIHFVDSAFTPDPSFLWIPLGGCMQEALAGALTLALDIVENEIALQTEFAHVFIDAGTGLSAIALILGFAILGKKTQIHVVLMAGTKQDFLEKLSIYHQYVKKQLQEEIVFPENFRLLFPCTAKSFGSVNGKVLQCIVNTAQKEGILLDPLYSSKLLLTIRETPIQEPTLWVHSGGVLSLTGFQELFKNYTG